MSHLHIYAEIFHLINDPKEVDRLFLQNVLSV